MYLLSLLLLLLLLVLRFLYCFVYVYLFLFILSVLVQGLLPPSDNKIAVINSSSIKNNNNNNWSQWSSNEKLKEKFGRYTRKTHDRFTTKDSYT